MTPTKQTVYIPAKENGNYSIHWNKDKIFNSAVMQEGYFFTPEQLNEYTQNVIKQALETAAENIGFIETTSEKLNSEEYKPFITADDDTIWTVDKQSIRSTFQETYKKFEV